MIIFKKNNLYALWFLPKPLVGRSHDFMLIESPGGWSVLQGTAHVDHTWDHIKLLDIPWKGRAVFKRFLEAKI